MMNQETDRQHDENETADIPNPRNMRECIICCRLFDQANYIDHVQICSESTTISKNTKECIICRKPIVENHYVAHVNECLSTLSQNSHSKTSAKRDQNTCFICSFPIAQMSRSRHVMPCRFHHMLCIKCVRNVMNEHITSNTEPHCNSTICEYQLSRYDVSCLPLEPDMITRLLALVTTQRRPQCPRCLFYVDFQTMANLQQHVIKCDPDDRAPCEYCHCPYRFYQLDEHSRYCRNIPVHQRRQALIDFILPRLKYPWTPVQIRIFIEKRRKKRRIIDAHEIVDELAECEDIFPFEVPALECSICMDACPYEDIFVFGCTDNHKLCYNCYEQSCTTKMNSNEVLTCGMCAYQLQDGEINQLRVSKQQKRIFLEYQLQKTFNIYASQTRGVIKCPNQDCKWVIEAQDPNERFRVVCRSCTKEFCSICNQQYHYRTTCQQVPQITQRWFFWCNTERGNYWRARAPQDAAFQAQLEDYERQIAANAQRNEELRRRYDELMADEEFKVRDCRLCPHCRRVVQHMGGCTSMICGQNYHGGDQQSGCGKNFDWDEATPYTPTTNTRPEQIRNDLPRPENKQVIKHEGIKCDACHNDVEGIRFDCIHCPSLIYCEKCEQRCTLVHSEELGRQQKQQHVFQLITTPQVLHTRRR